MTQRAWMRLFLLGLPVGLAVSVVAGIYFYYHPLDVLPDRSRQHRAVAPLLRKSPTEHDLADYRRVLTEVAARPVGLPERVRAAGNWIASTLGPSNMGHAVRVEEIEDEAGGHVARPVWVELPGQRSPDQVLLVGAGYASGRPAFDSASSAAVLLTVANAFVNAPQRETVVFAFFDDSATVEAAETADAFKPPGLEPVIRHLQGQGRVLSGIVLLDPASEEPGGMTPPGRMLFSDAHATFTRQVREALLPRLPGWTADLPMASEDEARTAFPTVVLSPAAAPSPSEPALLSLAIALEASLPSLANR